MTCTACGVGSLATKKRGQDRPRHWPRGTLGASPPWRSPHLDGLLVTAPPDPPPPATPEELFWEADDIRGAPGSHPPPGRQTDGTIYMEEMQPCHPPAPSCLLLPLLPPLCTQAAAYIRSLADGRSQDPPPRPGLSARARTALSQWRPGPPIWADCPCLRP